MLEPIRPMLILPEALGGTKWKRGSLWFMGRGDRYVLRLFTAEE